VNATSYSVSGFENGDLKASSTEQISSSKTAYPGANDADIAQATTLTSLNDTALRIWHSASDGVAFGDGEGRRMHMQAAVVSVGYRRPL
jgi:hypothetical protein